MSIKEELLALQASSPDGLLRVERAHDWADANKKSDLHRSLQWDDKIAGREYRLQQLRTFIRIYVIDENRTPMLVSLSVDRADTGGYRQLTDVIKSRTMSDILLEDALRELARVQAKFDRVKELVSVWEQVAKVRRKTKAKQGRRGSSQEVRA